MNFFEMCKTGHFEEILSKIREGIDVNTKDENGWTPLMYAAWYNQLDRPIDRARLPGHLPPLSS